jgi:hypothetical protein
LPEIYLQNVDTRGKFLGPLVVQTVSQSQGIAMLAQKPASGKSLLIGGHSVQNLDDESIGSEAGGPISEE